jgi:hypothetical protein
VQATAVLATQLDSLTGEELRRHHVRIQQLLHTATRQQEDINALQYERVAASGTENNRQYSGALAVAKPRQMQ